MSFRFDTPLIAGAFHFGNRGLGVLGSEVPSSGTNGAGYIYGDLSLPADANKEYIGFITSPPGVGTFFAFEDSSYLYSGPSTSFTYELKEDGVSLGSQTVTINVVSPEYTLSWSEADDVNQTSVSSVMSPTAEVSWLEVDDTFAVQASVVVSCIGMWSEESDITLASVAIAQPIVFVLSWTEADDVHNIGLSSAQSAYMSWMEANDLSYVYVSLDGVGVALPLGFQIKFKNPKYKITFKER